MKIVHLSDIHFGAVDAAAAGALPAYVRSLNADVLVVSGDFTQRGRAGQFRAAAEWVRSMGLPVVAVPGNHDVSVYAMWRRVSFPLTRFERWVGELPSSRKVLIGAPGFVGRIDCAWRWEFPGWRFVGLNSARRLAGDLKFPLTNGGLSERQMAIVEREAAGMAAGVQLAVVMHHPLLAPVGMEGKAGMTCRHAVEIVRRFSAGGVGLVLSGHLHRAYVTKVGGMMVVQAGTAISNRLRDEAPSFNVIGAGVVVHRFVEGQWKSG